MIRWVRSLLFLTFGFGSVAVAGVLIILLFWMPASWKRAYLVNYCNLVVWAGDFFCGMKFVVEGRENIPDEPSVIMIKHTTPLETYGHVPVVPPTSWVVKRELLWAPIVGWAIGLLFDPIAINRSSGRSAVKQVIEQGKKRLASGTWVTIYPEGTRVRPGEARKYGISGAALAEKAGVKIVPVAHNAGDLWRRREFTKRAGTVRFVIGPPIDATAQSPRETTAIVQEWIESRMREISSPCE